MIHFLTPEDLSVINEALSKGNDIEIRHIDSGVTIVERRVKTIKKKVMRKPNEQTK